MRKKIIAANWKMNKLPNEAISFIEQITPLIKDETNEVIIFVPYIDLFYALMFTQGTNIKIGAQNMHWEECGAYTGEISGQMLASLGLEYVLIGHSERRVYFGETDEQVNKKIKSALKNNLKPVICIGEDIKQKEAGETSKVIEQQLSIGLKEISKEQMKFITIAYEPLWAISGYGGTTASKEDANESIKIVRNQIEKMYGQDVAENITIQYGGSVKSSNAKELFDMSDIDGGLVGNASLDAIEFSKIVKSM